MLESGRLHALHGILITSSPGQEGMLAGCETIEQIPLVPIGIALHLLK